VQPYRVGGVLRVASLLAATLATNLIGAERPPDCLWAMRVGGASAGQQQNWISPVDVDAKGNVYAGGYFGIPSLTLATTNLLSSNGYGFLARFDPSGGLCWAVQLANYPQGMKTDAEGNCYLIGGTRSSIVPGGTNLVEGTGTSVAYLAKFDSSGQLLWGKALAVGQPMHLQGVAVDAEGNSYVVAVLTATNVSFCGTNLVVPDGYRFCLAKLSAAGEPQWAQLLGSSSYGYGVKVAVDATSNVYVVGTIQGTGIFGQNMLTNHCGAFLAKYDPEGNVCWVRSSEGASACAVNVGSDSQGNILAVGVYYGPVIFGDFTVPHAGDDGVVDNGFVVKYDPSGQVCWARGIGGGDLDRASGVASDSAGSVYVVGEFSSLVTHFDGLSLTNSKPPGWYTRDGFLVKYSPTGEVRWAVGFGGWQGDDQSGSVTVDPVGNCYLAGSLLSPVVAFGTNAPPRFGYQDGFLAKYRTSAPPLLTTSFVDGQLQLSWPTLLPDFRLEMADGLTASGSWQSNSAPVTAVGLSNIVCQPASSSQHFFRLTCP
jgi:hypothetical protein